LATSSSESAVQPVAPSVTAADHYHAVRFYEGEKSLAQITAKFLVEGLADHHPAIVVATPSMRAALIIELTAQSFDVVELQRSGELVLLDAKGLLSAFMIDGKPHPARFNDMMCEVIDQVCRGRSNCKVRIFGQMVDLLWREGQQEAAIQLEMLWNQLARNQAFSLLCGYAMGNFYKDSPFQEICGQHSHVVADDGHAKPVESARSATFREPVERASDSPRRSRRAQG
jgi:MEDS: MEthanogen/methylotroph, DcmR Sensory domain